MNEMSQGGSLNMAQRHAIADILREQSQKQVPLPQKRTSDQENTTAGIRSNRTSITKANISAPIGVPQHEQQQPQQQRPSSGGDVTAGGTNQYHHQQKQQQQQKQKQAEARKTQLHAADSSSDSSWYGEETGGGDEYANISDCVRTAEILKVFDDVLTEWQDEETDMLAMANQQLAISQQQRRPGPAENTSSGARSPSRPPGGVTPGGGVTEDTKANRLRPVPQQRTSYTSDPQADQFKQLLAEMAATRKQSQQPEPAQTSTQQPMPAVARKTVTVEAGAASKPTPPVKQKPRMPGDANSQPAAHHEGPRPVTQRRSADIGRQQFPPSSPPAPAPAAVTTQPSYEFDLPPPPDEYCNLPPMPPSHHHHQQQHHQWTGRTAVTLPPPLASDNYTFPPPPSGFHDDVPASRTRQPAPLVRASSTGGSTIDGPMISWSCEDVMHWLQTMKMPEHCAAFASARIDGQNLILLTPDDFYVLGVTQFGQRMMLQRAIENRDDS